MSTPAQTVGPYLALGLAWTDGPDVVAPSMPDAVWLRGTVRDGAGEPVPDAVVETWQADADGRFNHPADPRGAVAAPGFRGFGRCTTNAEGDYGVRTVVPGAVPVEVGSAEQGQAQAPHIDISVLARGLLHRVVTRVYFPEHSEQHQSDPVLRTVPADRRATLIAARTEDGYRFDIRLQGDQETVFFDV
ncbi:protocatechuate 3,4-dioxygenase subunit alpha [Crossiella sp. CA198]|uniref:protocatechuate 3,4-dioxygenase subunit alpha n=1 Tax=Crossiella sp. CA198 TaxID=3455607 RepID=UPI003F8D536B